MPSPFIAMLTSSRSRLRRSPLVLTAALALGGAAAPAEKVDFAREVLPILSNKCFVCHGPDTKKKKQLRLDSYQAATADRGGYHAIDPVHPEDSEIIVRLHDKDDPMPPEDAEKQLTDAEREILSRWAKEGGQYAKHWSFVPPRKSAPQLDDSLLGIIDAFVSTKLHEKTDGRVMLAPEADRATLARRVALVLTGLPPEPGLLASFLADNKPDAYQRLVEELLQSSRFGEHQARYWLDAVRYGDTHGLHLDNKRGIYPYRDWVVRSFNKNMPLDKFITWQLAGDLLPNPTVEQRVATGFVRMNPTTAEGGAIPAEFQCKNNFDRTETLGTVLLGITMTCSRCHNHKYDPITQTEYYQLLAFFNSTAESPMDGNKYEYGPVLKVPADQQSWLEWEKIQKEREDLLASVLHKNNSEEISPEVAESFRGTTPEGQFNILLKADTEIAKKRPDHHRKATELKKRMDDARKRFTPTLVAKELGKPRETKVLMRGEYDRPLGEPLQPGVPAIMGSLPKDAPRNRLGLAHWLTSRENPLLARVLMNRIWQRVYGDGLVRSPEDFGLQGKQPTHPELLDWLAVELMENKWDLRHMLRLMVNSNTFKQQSARRKIALVDPENLYYSRGPSYRLDAEVLRDVALWTSNLLDPHMGGEGVKPYQPAGLWKALMHPGSNTKNYVKDSGPKLYRRSLYVYWKRTSPHPMMMLFDAPDRESSCVRRSRTSTSLQSLGLLNETQRIEMSRKFAERLLKEAKTDQARLDLLFTLIACRPPTDGERQACNGLLEHMRARYAASKDDALALLATGDSPRDEALDPAQVAAWTQVAVTVLASDVAILLY
ncbi:MAG: PSD1 and planctomycete cytochrome C domain-containing protein [Roseibacillus sp.]